MATGAEDALVHHHHQHQQHNRHHNNHHHPQQQHGGSNSSWWSVSVSEDNLSASFTTNNSGLSLAESGELGQRSELVESSPSSAAAAAAAAASFHANMEEAHSAAAACVSAVPDNQLWNQVLMNVGSGCSDGGNLYQMMSSRTLRAPLMDGTENHHHHQQQQQHSGFVKTEEVQDSSAPWGLSSLGSSGLQLHAEDDMGVSISSLDKPLDMDLNPLSLSYSNAFSCNVADWSLGPPVAQHDSNPQPQRPAMAAAAPASSFNPCVDFPLINSDRAKHECGGGSSALSFVADNSTTHMTLNGIPLLQGIKAESSCRSNNPGFQNQEHHPVILEGSPTKLFRSIYSGSILGATEDYGPIKFQHCNTLRHGTKPVLDYNGSYKPFLRNQPQLSSSSSSSQTRTVGNQSRESSSEAMKKRNNGDGSGSSHDSVFKRPRFENSSSSTPSYKSQVPKVKLGDRITALQQLVSPFGKTDTASVLWDAISYIKYLHEQVQALSNPYMKAGGSQADQNCWGESYSSSSSSSKDASREPKLDLKSRGLCLVPVSCTLQVSGDMTPDYWQHTLGGSFR